MLIKDKIDVFPTGKFLNNLGFDEYRDIRILEFISKKDPNDSVSFNPVT